MSDIPDTEVPGLSRRQAIAVGGGLAATLAAGSLVTAGSAAAQEDDDDDPGDAERKLSVSLSQANAILRAAESKATEIGVPMYIVVVDVCGDPKAESRQDGNAKAAVVLAPLKAHTALAFRTPTATLAERTTDPVRAQSFLAAGFTLLGGGIPIVHDDQVIGAVGVGGGSPEQDIEVAEAGLAALS